MKIKRMRIDLTPLPDAGSIRPMLYIHIQGDKEITFSEVFPVDDFESTFDRLMSRAAYHIKGYMKGTE